MILRILPLLLATILIPDLYIYFRHLRKTSPTWAQILYWAPAALLLFFALWLVYTEDLSPENMDAIVLYISAYMILTLPKTAYTLLSWLGWLIGRIFPCYRKVGVWISSLGAAAVLSVMLWGLTIGPNALKQKNFTYYSDQLPDSFNGYRLVQITDLHLISFRNNPEMVSRMVAKVNALQPDAICFTGDLISTDDTELQGFEQILKQLKARDGVFSILGNHDYITYAHYLPASEQKRHFERFVKRQAQMGWKLLRNENQIIHRGQDSILIAGVENDGKPPFPQRGDLKKALKGTENNPDLFKILLSHDPTHWRRKVLPETNIQLTLSGHTHGMQFMIGNWSPSEFFYPEWRGAYYEGNRALYVSLGVGGALIPFRFGAWPEINLITLHKK